MSYLIHFSKPSLLAGKYLKGPYDPKRVKRNGYGFTTDPAEAWPFPSKAQAAAKARIVWRHLGHHSKPTGVEIIPQAAPMKRRDPSLATRAAIAADLERRKGLRLFCTRNVTQEARELAGQHYLRSISYDHVAACDAADIQPTVLSQP